jgi:hypothetical protein
MEEKKRWCYFIKTLCVCIFYKKTMMTNEQFTMWDLSVVLHHWYKLFQTSRMLNIIETKIFVKIIFNQFDILLTLNLRSFDKKKHMWTCDLYVWVGLASKPNQERERDRQRKKKRKRGKKDLFLMFLSFVYK